MRPDAVVDADDGSGPAAAAPRRVVTSSAARSRLREDVVELVDRSGAEARDPNRPRVAHAGRVAGELAPEDRHALAGEIGERLRDAGRRAPSRARARSRAPSIPSTRASASVPAASSASTAAPRDERHAVPASTALRTDSWSPSSSRTSRSRSRTRAGAARPRRSAARRRPPASRSAARPQLVGRRPSRPRSGDRAGTRGRPRRRRTARTGPRGDAAPRRRCRARARVARRARRPSACRAPRARRGRPGARAGTRREAAARRSRPARSRRRSRAAREVALRVRRDVGEQLLLEREQPLRAAVEAPAGLGRLDAAPRAVEELRAEPLLERPHLQRDRRLRDAEPLGRLREAASLDDRAERSKLPRIHKRSLSQLVLSLVREDAPSMRVWIDITNSPHVVFFRPLVALLRERGDDVTITAREFAQTLELLEAAGLPHRSSGRPTAGVAAREGPGDGGALRALRPFAREGRGSTSRSRTPRTSCRSRAVARHAVVVRVRLRVRAAQHGSGAARRRGSSFPT